MNAMNALFTKSAETAKTLSERNMQFMGETFQNSLQTSQAMMQSKDVAKAMELQTGFAKEFFQAYTQEINEQAKIYSEFWRNTVKPV